MTTNLRPALEPHVALLAALADILLDPDGGRALREATDPAAMVGMFNAMEDRG